MATVLVFTQQDGSNAVCLADIDFENTPGRKVNFLDLPQPGTIYEFEGRRIRVARLEVDMQTTGKGHALITFEIQS